MWQHVLYASIWTIIIAIEDFEQIHNDVLAKIADNLRRSSTDMSDIEDNAKIPKQIQTNAVQFQLKTLDQNQPQKLEFRLENPLANQTSRSIEPINQDGRRRHNVPHLRNMAWKPQAIKNKRKIKHVFANDTLNFPYMAAIIINGRVWCAGSLVDENWVLTAAHCLNYVIHVSPLNSLGHYVKVRVGSVQPHEGGKLFDVIGAVRHPKFEEEPVPHADVALLKLSANVVLGKHVNIIKIYGGVNEPFAQSFVVVSGWGATRGSDTAFREHTPDLSSGRLKVRSQHYCMDAYQLVNGFQFTPDFFCASLRNGTRDVCLFDAGAPAVQHNQLMGIMSFGPEHCGHDFQPAVFIKAFYFRDFVKSTISSYKTTQELIEAMRDIDPALRDTATIEDTLLVDNLGDESY